jgi:hypothetical protein
VHLRIVLPTKRKHRNSLTNLGDMHEWCHRIGRTSRPEYAQHQQNDPSLRTSQRFRSLSISCTVALVNRRMALVQVLELIGYPCVRDVSGEYGHTQHGLGRACYATVLDPRVRQIRSLVARFGRRVIRPFATPANLGARKVRST